MTAVTKLIPAGTSLLRKEGIVEVDHLENGGVTIKQLKTAYKNLQLKNASEFLSLGLNWGQLDWLRPIQDELFAGPPELLRAWKIVNRVKSPPATHKSDNKRKSRSVKGRSTEDQTTPKKKGKKTKNKRQGPTSTRSSSSITQMVGKC